jgi:hypothetical protein
LSIGSGQHLQKRSLPRAAQSRSNLPQFCSSEKAKVFDLSKNSILRELIEAVPGRVDPGLSVNVVNVVYVALAVFRANPLQNQA